MKTRSMLFRHRILYAVTVVAIAFASGHFVQSEGKSSAEASAQGLFVAEAAEPDIGVPLAFTCARDAQVESGIAGMLRVALRDSCSPETKVTVAQGALVADWLLDETGERVVSFAPLLTDMPVTVTWSDGSQDTFEITQSNEPAHFRAALTWTGPQFLSIVPQELGLEQTASSQSQNSEASSLGGFLTKMGDGIGRTAQVYTFPAETHVTGVVRLSVAAPVTIGSCARSAVATALQTDPFGGVFTSRVDIALPECDSVGQTLVLRNLFRDLRLAAR